MGYDINDIQHLDTKEAMRQRISVYLGSDDTEGIYQSLKEIINNSTDEALAGYGNLITIDVDEEKNKITVKDEGRGVPFGIKDGKNVLVSVYTESHTGGKFTKDAYKNSSGLNGLGATACCMSSAWFLVQSTRNGITASAEFEHGDLKDYKEEKTTNKNGTTVSFIPDKEVFKNMTDNYSYDRICQEIKDISYFNKGVKFIVTSADKKTEFLSKNGIADFINEVAEKPLMKPIFCSAKDEMDEVEVAFVWTKGAEKAYTFVNALAVPDGGSPITGAKTALTTQIKKLSKKDFDGDLIRRGLVYVINCKVLNPSFANQTKSKINNANLRTLANQAFKEGLEKFAKSGEFETIIEMLAKIQRAENAADKAREAVLQSNSEINKELKKKVILADKLADSRFHDERSQLMICEGHSAKGALVKSRDSNTTACFELRGKLINVLKNTEDRSALNDEIKMLHVALGCGVGDKFNIKKLRYGKVVIMADMDKDGYSIVCLVLSFFYHYYPQLLEAGKVWWGVTPLFKVEKGKDVYFAYSDEELKALPSGNVSRLKGLGESQPEDFRKTIFSKDAKMVKITMKDAEEAWKYFDILLGENIEARKDYIFSHVDFENLED